MRSLLKYEPLSSVNPRQGKRKKDRWGLCMECGHPTAIRAACCKHWRCQDHLTLRRVPGQIGIYRVRCLPKCRLRRRPEVATAIRMKERPRPCTLCGNGVVISAWCTNCGMTSRTP